MMRRWGLTVAVLGLMAGAAGRAGAGVVLYTNGSGNLGGNDPFTYEYVAQDFTLAQDSVLQGIGFNVYTTSATAAPTAAHVRIYSDVAGAVGPELLSGDFSVSDRGATGTDGYYTYRDYAVGLPSWALGAGHYYLGLEVEPNQFDFHWTITSPYGTPIGDGSYQSPTGGTGTYTSYAWEHAFQLTGEAVTAVPEPSTLASAGIACAMGLGYTLRRRKAVATA